MNAITNVAVCPSVALKFPEFAADLPVHRGDSDALLVIDYDELRDKSRYVCVPRLRPWIVRHRRGFHAISTHKTFAAALRAAQVVARAFN